ncbi:hypothetical protein [Maricaulis parjimensis]|uniref:hypothetical protein n=1 Tax=Maricaulis parjimensis TaxID=144023 RepID=UPI00193A5E6D|nr:hypothetical protein [Maricaulis parjimensis]
MPPELKQKLKQVLAGRSSVDMGQFQFLNLDKVREGAGGDWERLREKVYDVSNHFIEKRLDAGDVVIRCQGGYLIIFETMDAEAAALAVSEIAEELEHFFLGDRELSLLKVLGEARSVPTEELLEIVARTQAEVPAAAKKPKTVKPSADTEPAPPWKREKRAASDDKAITDWKDAPRPDPKPEYAHRPEAVYKESNAVWDDIVFKPCWDSRRSALLHNICVARRVVKGFAYYGRDTLMGSDDRVLHRKLDESVARAAQRGFQKAYSQGWACAIIVPVHYDTIATLSQRMKYFNILQSVPEAMRRYFFLRVDGVPKGAPLGQMQEIFRSMKPFGAYVLAHLDFGAADLKRFEGCGVGIFSAEVPARMNEDGPADSQVIALSEWVASAQSHKAETYLTQTSTLDVLEAGLSVGVRYFSGEVILPETPLPEPARPLTLSEIRDSWHRDHALHL